MRKYKLDVFILSDESRDDLKHVAGIFGGTSRRGTTANVTILSTRTRSCYDKDYQLVLDALSRSDDDTFVIVCKDTSITTCNPDEVLDVCDAAVRRHRRGKYFDLFYLSKWMDRCDFHTNLYDVKEHGLRIVDTVSPNGVQCIMFSPEGKYKFETHYDIEKNPIVGKPLGLVLNENIVSRKTADRDYGARRYKNTKKCPGFVASAAHPSIIHFDITKRKFDSETLKTTECAPIPKMCDPTDTDKGNLGLFWFVIIIFICFILVWAIYKLGVIRYAGGCEKYYSNTPHGYNPPYSRVHS